jgi:putative hemolysin
MPEPKISPSSDRQVFSGAFQRIVSKPLMAPMSGAISKLLKMGTIDRLYNDSRRSAGGLGFCGEVLRRLNVTVDVAPGDLDRIPRKGAVVAVANHPFGMVEGIALIRLLSTLRPDFRVLANEMLCSMEELRPWMIPVDPFGGEEASRANRRGLKAAFELLHNGGMLLIFPAGEVSHLQFRHPGIYDPSWNRIAAALIRRTGAQALPLFFDGTNSALFQVAGLVHPRLRTALLGRELLNKRDHVLKLKVGYPAPAVSLEGLSDDEATELLRRKTYWLAHRKAHTAPKPRRRILPHNEAPLCEAIPTEWLQNELRALPPDCLLVESGEWQVWLATRAQCPFTIREIGRLRELTFRAAGEGTGKAYDLDHYDDHYVHLVLWRKDASEIAGGYRMCGTDQANGRLYTKTLYRFNAEFFRRITPAVELGRSFIRDEYQRSFQPLLMLWRGIGQFAVRHPHYRYLFGPVSISNTYQRASRVLMANTLLRLAGMPEIKGLAKPRRPFYHLPVNGLPKPDTIEEMEAWVSDLEPAGEGVPVLVRQYLKMGGKIATFHVDRSFGETLDGLIVVDLANSEPRLLERYLGKAGTVSYLAVQKAAMERQAS